MADIVDELRQRYDPLCNQAARDIERLRAERDFAVQVMNQSLSEDGDLDEDRPQVDPNWLIYALGLIMAGAMYCLVYVFTVWGRR